MFVEGGLVTGMEMEIPSAGFLGIGIAVLVATLVALTIKLMLLAVMLDQWIDIRTLVSDDVRRLVMEDDLRDHIGRVANATLLVVLGVTWVVVAVTVVTRRSTVTLTALVIVLAGVIVFQTVLAVSQSIRAYRFRRKMRQVFTQLPLPPMEGNK